MDIVNSNSNDCSLIRVAALRQAALRELYNRETLVVTIARNRNG
jgi:hypothetical protein